MIGECVDIIEQLLDRVPRPDGFVAAHLVDGATGQVLAGVVGHGDARPPGSDAAVAALAAGTARAFAELGAALALQATDDDPEDLIVTTSGHHPLARLLPDLGGTDAFLLVTLDRARANLALARHLLQRLEVQLVP